MQPVPVSERVKQAPDFHLRVGVLAPDSGHVEATLCPSVYVNHYDSLAFTPSTNDSTSKRVIGVPFGY
jgi:hypothetical protein